MASAAGLTNAAGARNTRYYTRIFNQFENGDGAWKPSWNWAAFICSTGWFFFRRMFLFGAINLAVLLMVALPHVVHLTSGEASIARGALAVYLVLAFGVLPFFADWIYYLHLKRRLTHGGATAPDMISFGAAAAATTAAASALIFAGVIASSTDYDVRVQVVDALLAVAPYKTAVETVVKQKGALPATTAELPPVGATRPHPGIKLADLAPGGIVRVVFTGFRHIDARSIEIVPTLNDKTVEWRCYNIDMPDKELPVQCRVTRARPAAPVVPVKAG
jgi:Pilin (bacterial filament)/Protein of unknown function (DUF2628)